MRRFRRVVLLGVLLPVSGCAPGCPKPSAHARPVKVDGRLVPASRFECIQTIGR